MRRFSPPYFSFNSSTAIFFQKLTVSLLVFSLIVPIIPLNAQTVSDTEPPPTESVSTETSVVAPSDITPTTETPTSFPPLTNSGSGIAPESEITPTDITPVLDEIIDETPPDENPPDSLLSSVDPAPFNESARQPAGYSLRVEPESVFGSLIYEYPIILPPGRNGLDPNLKLLYSSQSNDLINPFEYGWSSNIPYIERINKKGTDSLYTNYYFNSSIDGELYSNSVSTSTESYGPRNENGNFSKYEYKNQNYWLVTDKKGTTYKFGTTTGARQDDPSDSTHIYKWMLEEVRDTNNNYIKYEYYKEGGQIFPLKITYTGNNSTDGKFTVDFVTGVRGATGRSSKPGFRVATQYHIAEINIKINSILVRKYVLSYSAGDTSTRYLLNSITETGQDEFGNQLSLPSTTFTYQTSTSTGWASSSPYASPTAFVDSSGVDNGVRIVDVTGDALPDILVGRDHAYINKGNGNGYVDTASWYSPAEFIMPGGLDAGVRVLDLNGDGLADIFAGDPDFATMSGYMNNGLGYTASTTWDPATTTIIKDGLSFANRGVRFADVNGDNLPDIMYASDPNAKKTYLNNGQGWDSGSTATWESPIYFVGSGSAQIDLGVRLVDIDGDGMTDIMKAIDGTRTTYINNGNGFTTDSNWASPIDFITSSKDMGVRFADVNGDGWLDLLRSNGTDLDAYLSFGYGFSSTANWNVPKLLVGSDGVDIGARISDINGDGVADILYASSTMETWINKNKPADLLITAVNNKGGQTDIEYKPSPFYVDGSSSVINNHLPMVLQTVRKITSSDGLGLSTFFTWIYGGGKYFFSNSFDRRPSGFATTTKTDPSGAYEKTYFHQGDATYSTIGEYSDNQSKIGKIFRTENYDSSNNLYSKTISKWDKTDLGYSRNFVKLAQSVKFDYDGDGDHKDKAESYAYDSTYGNLSSKVTWGEVTGSDDGTFSDTGSDLGKESFAYATNTSQYVVGLPYINSLYDQNSNKVRETKFYFDRLQFGNIGNGNKTADAFWKTGSLFNVASTSFNSYGLVASTTNPRGYVTTYTYDGYNLYPATTTDAVNQTVQNYFDYSNGKAKQTIDKNGFIAKTTFDAFDRPTAVIIPDRFAGGTLSTSTTYTYTDTALAVKVQQTDYLSATTSVDTYTYFDGLARKIQERKEDESTDTYDVTDTVYNTLGLVDKQSLPYTSTGSAKTSATGDSTLYTTYTYDALQRPNTLVDALGTTAYSYDQWKTTVTDPLSNTKGFYKDAYNNLIQVDEVASTTYSTTYSWNLNNLLTQITDAVGNYRTIAYDGQGLRTDVQDLHAPADTNFGTWNYTYNANGGVATVTDPKGTVVIYSYDGIDRITSEDSSSGTGVEVTYSYDGCSNGIGLLCKVYSSQATSTYMYDTLGRVRQEGKVILGTVASTTYDYDQLGNLQFLTYPDSSTAKYEYNTAGLLEKISRKESTDSSYTTVVSNFNYAPTRQASSITYANGDGETYTFDATKKYRLTNKTSTSSTNSTLQDLTYTYDSVGNITRIVDASLTATAKTTDYTYDQLYRLTIASTTNATTSPDYRITYGYTALGNIASTSLMGDYSYQGNLGSTYANPHAVTSITTSGGGSVISTSTIAFVASSTSITNGFNSGPVTKTWTHTVSDTSPIIILTADIWQDVAGTGSVTSASWNGGAFTKATSTRSVGMASEVWYLVATTTGSKTMSVTVTGATDAIKLSASSFSNVTPYTPLDALNTARGASGNPTVSVTLGTGDVVLATLSRFSTTDATTSQTSLFKDKTGSVLGAASYVIGTTSGSYSDTYTGSVTQDWSMIITGFKPATTTSGGGGTTTTYTYDNNGNLLTNSLGLSNTWDYNNRLTQSVFGTTTTYAYDHTGARVKYSNGTLTTTYPNKYYSSSTSSTIKNIFAGDRLLATIENSLATSSAGSVSTSTPALDSTSTSITTGFVVGPVTKTWTHTVTGTDPLIVLSADIFQDVGGIGTITSASWNGGAFTKASSTRTGTKATEMWYLVATTTGAKTMSVTISGDTDAIKMAASSFTGISRYSPLDVKASSNGSSGNPSVSLTTLNQSDVIVTTINRHSTTDATTTQTSLYKDRVTSTLGASSYILGTTTKLYTDTYVGSASQNWSMIMGAFRPATSTSGGSVATASTTVRYVHSDHLGSPIVITNASSTIAETIDYYPFGQTKFDNNTTNSNVSRKYIDQYYDADTSLSYLNARYYNGQQGQFLSEDPVFLGPADKQNLKDPQSLNSYSYANGNPIVKSDPTGRCAGPLLIGCLAIIGAGISSYANYASDVIDNRNNNSQNPYTENLSSPQSYLLGDVTGGFSLAFLSEYRITSAGLSAYTSLKQDELNGKKPDYKKALIGAGISLVTGVAFGSAVGKGVSNQFTGRVTGEVFGNAMSLAVQNFASTYNSSRTYNESVQSRQQAVQSYNSGKSGPQNQLWVTPSGVVVNWGGEIVSGSIKK